MATTVNSDLIIYNDLAQTAYLERIQDVIDVFNASSNGAIIFDNELIEGDLRKRSFYKIGGAMEHRDVNSSSAVTGKKIGAAEMVGVKVPFKYGPYETTEEAFKRRARSPEEFSELLGQDYADAVLEGYVQYAMAALMASIGSNADMVAAASFATDGKKALTKGMRKFGDRFGRIALWTMDSATYFDMVDQAITEKIYEEAGVVIYGGQPGTMGKPVLVADSMPAETIFGLQSGAVKVTESQAPGFRSYNIDNQENLAIGFRAEGTFNLDVMGYSWKDATGGVNPNLAAVGAAANWNKYATSNKATAGVLIDLSAP
ncbi:major capsid protein [Pseudomonas alloputida]|uniref:major capsid protein n=1 Tax=Pseudomonas alloputida TaxID=1940621 RepID=UPI001E5779BD|nr:major capsid protein [Pseudomonas alloputida]MCE1053408.1 major capsid protein [Pseudomonas alloputida]